jgi:hypothetical protein
MNGARLAPIDSRIAISRRLISAHASERLAAFAQAIIRLSETTASKR